MNCSCFRLQVLVFNIHSQTWILLSCEYLSKRFAQNLLSECQTVTWPHFLIMWPFCCNIFYSWDLASISKRSCDLMRSCDWFMWHIWDSYLRHRHWWFWVVCFPLVVTCSSPAVTSPRTCSYWCLHPPHRYHHCWKTRWTSIHYK